MEKGPDGKGIGRTQIKKISNGLGMSGVITYIGIPTNLFVYIPVLIADVIQIFWLRAWVVPRQSEPIICSKMTTLGGAELLCGSQKAL
jgi:hypothetical protein